MRNLYRVSVTLIALSVGIPAAGYAVHSDDGTRLAMYVLIGLLVIGWARVMTKKG